MTAAATRVKVCGLTRAEDVRRAVALGAWACGFVLTASPRRVAPHWAAQLAAVAGGALTVGVFTTEAAPDIAAAAAAAGVAAIQLSAGADGPSVSAVRVAAATRGLRPLVIAAAGAGDAAEADYVLLDGRVPGLYGGTGRTADWDEAARLAARTRLMLAGGLRPDNVAAAVAAAHPFAVDASSGVEREPGIKDHELLAAFFAAVAAAGGPGGSAA
jgi:phosphoribosylanthranilate isomerase